MRDQKTDQRPKSPSEKSDHEEFADALEERKEVLKENPVEVDEKQHQPTKRQNRRGKKQPAEVEATDEPIEKKKAANGPKEPTKGEPKPAETR